MKIPPDNELEIARFPFSDGAIECAVWMDPEAKMIMRALRKSEGEWYVPKKGCISDVAMRLTYLWKTLKVDEGWKMLEGMLELPS